MRIISIVLVLTGIFYSVLYACSCSGLNTPEVEYEYSKAVFLGTVTNIQPDTVNRDNYVTFTVVESWKGVPGDTISVLTAMDGPACGYQFEPGETYLVYAFNGSPFPLFTSSCSRTRNLLYATEDLIYLSTVNSASPTYGSQDSKKIGLSSFLNYLNTTITIRYTIPEAANIVISIYSISGQLVETLHDGYSRAGASELNVDFSHFSSGIYIATLKSEYGHGMTKLSIIR